MQTITTTELRTKTKQLVVAMRAGKRVSLIHRSRFIGTIEPMREEFKDKVMTKEKIKKLEKLIDEIGPLKPLSYKERERRYSEHLEKKYGKYLS